MMAPAGGEGGSGAGSSQPPEPVVPFPMGRAPMIGSREIYLFSFFSFSLLFLFRSFLRLLLKMGSFGGSWDSFCWLRALIFLLSGVASCFIFRCPYWSLSASA